MDQTLGHCQSGRIRTPVQFTGYHPTAQLEREYYWWPLGSSKGNIFTKPSNAYLVTSSWSARQQSFFGRQTLRCWNPDFWGREDSLWLCSCSLSALLTGYREASGCTNHPTPCGNGNPARQHSVDWKKITQKKAFLVLFVHFVKRLYNSL